jgi:hypothetical protein
MLRIGQAIKVKMINVNEEGEPKRLTKRGSSIKLLFSENFVEATQWPSSTTTRYNVMKIFTAVIYELS